MLLWYRHPRVELEFMEVFNILDDALEPTWMPIDLYSVICTLTPILVILAMNEAEDCVVPFICCLLFLANWIVTILHIGA